MATSTQIAAVFNYIATSTKYDTSTVEINDDGEVSAILDADKTFNGPHTDRLLVGTVSEILRDIAEAA